MKKKKKFSKLEIALRRNLKKRKGILNMKIIRSLNIKKEVGLEIRKKLVEEIK